MANKIVKTLKHYSEYDCDCNPSSISEPIEPDKKKTISQMTLKELSQMQNRLRAEREVENLVRDLKRSSGERDTYEEPFKIDVTTPIDQLYHAGIPGMKWGIRRFQNPDGTRTKFGKKRDLDSASKEENSEDFKKSREKMGKPISKLNNAELKSLNERLQLEKQYKVLTKKEMSPGKKFIVDLLADQGKKELKEFVAKQLKEVKNKSGEKVAEAVAEKTVKEGIKKATKESMENWFREDSGNITKLLT